MPSVVKGFTVPRFLRSTCCLVAFTTVAATPGRAANQPTSSTSNSAECSIQVLTAFDPIAGERFGAAAATDGDTLAISAVALEDPGSVYVFRHVDGTWVPGARLVSPTPSGPSFGGDEFGYRVSLSDDRIVVGAPGDSEAASRAGAIYVFKRSESSWTFETKLIVPVSWGSSQTLGSSVSISNGEIIAGAPGDSEAGRPTGAVYVFKHDGAQWVITQQIRPKLESATRGFGSALATDGNTLVVGANRKAQRPGRGQP